MFFNMIFFMDTMIQGTRKVVRASAALDNGPLHVFYFVRGFKIALYAIYGSIGRCLKLSFKQKKSWEEKT